MQQLSIRIVDAICCDQGYFLHTDRLSLYSGRKITNVELIGDSAYVFESTLELFHQRAIAFDTGLNYQ